MLKKKYYWTLQLFENGKPQTPLLIAKVYGRPAMPWYGYEHKWDHDIQLSVNNYLEFDGTTPRITRWNGLDKIIEEWDLLEVKIKDVGRCEDNRYDYLLVYKDTVYISHLCKKCHGLGGFVKRGSVWESETWHPCSECNGELV